MSVIFRNADQVRLFFDQWGNNLSLSLGDQLQASVKGFLSQKQQQYSGSAYLDQLEKNVIYLCEGTHNINLAMATYLVQGKPLLDPSAIPPFVEFIRIEQAQKAMPFHWNFVHEGCNSCLVHNDHQKYMALRCLRLAGMGEGYLEELEFSYQYFQATYMVSQNYLSAFLQNHEFASCARLIPFPEAEIVVNERVRLWSEMGMGYRQGYVGDVPAPEWFAQQSQVEKTKSTTVAQQPSKRSKKEWWKFWE
jgi:hypothetical protein